ALALEEATKNASVQVKIELKKRNAADAAKGGTQCYRFGPNRDWAHKCPVKKSTSNATILATIKEFASPSRSQAVTG
ncbi:hypothetical protein IscW_ISCW011935, partial [Ixodes scapularis]